MSKTQKNRASRQKTNPEKQWHKRRKEKIAVYAGIWKLIRPAIVYGCAFIALVGLMSTGWQSLNQYFLAPMDPADDAAVAVTVSSGSSLSLVSRQLEEKGLVRNSTVFKYYADLMGMGQRIQSGNYEMSRAMSAADLLERLVSGDGRPKTLRITIIPGWTIENTADYLVENKVFASKDRFLSLCRTGDAFKDVYFVQSVLQQSSRKDVTYALEGYLSPNTYEIYTSTDEESLIRRLLRQTESVYLTSYEERAEELGFSMSDVFTLASVIEKEAKTDDFAKVSAVFHNRLKKQMTLDSDATVKYVSGSVKMALNASDLAVDSPYNTYRRKGLPAGPICNPSMDAVMAALYPDEDYVKDQYLYFCSTDPNSGALHFSKTLEEHEAAVAMYRPLWEEYDQRRGAK